MHVGNILVDKLRLVAKSFPANPISGQIEFCDNKFYITNKSVRKAIDRTSDVALETVTVVNTTDETTMWTGLMPANSLVAGNMFKFNADGLVTNHGGTAVDEVTIRIRVGGVAMVTLKPNLTSLVDAHWHLDANATQRTVGISGSRAMHVDLHIGDLDVESLIAVGTINTTTDMNVTVTAQWSSAKIDNTISLYQGFMTYKN